MNWDNPGEVMRRAGTIEDSLAGIENSHMDAIAQELLLGDVLDGMRYTLREGAEGSSADDRKAWVERQVRQAPEYEQWLNALAAKRKFAQKFDSLSKRLSACQSVLKRLDDGLRPGYGPGQQNT